MHAHDRTVRIAFYRVLSRVSPRLCGIPGSGGISRGI